MRAPAGLSLRLVVTALAAAAVVAVGVVLLGGGKDTVSLDTVAEAAEATNDAGGFKLTVDGGIDGGERDVPIKARGELDTVAKRGHLIFDAGLTGGQGGQIEQIIDGDVVYMKMPALTQQLGSKAEWLRIDYTALGKELGADISSLQQQGGNDPRQLLAQLKAVSGDVEKLGTEKVRGVETTHYKTKVDLRKTPDSLPPNQREAARKGIEALIELIGSSSYPMEIWVDDDKLVRRSRIEYSFDVPSQDEKAQFEMTMELFDFGTQVNVTPPPDDKVADIGELARKIQEAQAKAGGSGQAPGGAQPPGGALPPPGGQQTP